MAARGRAAAVASRRAARARRGGQVIGRRVMGRRVTAPSDRSEPIVARPQLTSKACGARLSVSEGGRHVARREDDKCASYGSLFIGQSSGDGSVGQGEGRCGPVRPARFVARYGSRPNKFGRSWDAQQNQFIGKGATGAAKFTPRGTTYVFVNVVVAPRYVARVQPGSGGLKSVVRAHSVMILAVPDYLDDILDLRDPRAKVLC